jgi:hypothetical protein
MYQPQNSQSNQQPPQQQPGQPYPQQPQPYPQVKPLPPGWQQTIQPGQWMPARNDGVVMQYQPGNTIENAKKWYLYFIPGIACVGLVICVFLPWISISLLGSSITANGVGGTNTPPGFLESMAALSPNASSATPAQPETNSFFAHDGFIVLVVGVIGVILSLGGLIQRYKGYAVGTIIISLVTLGIFGYEFWNVSHAISDANAQIAATASQNIFGVGLSVGFGIYLGLIMSLIVLISSIVTLIIFNPKLNSNY